MFVQNLYCIMCFADMPIVVDWRKEASSDHRDRKTHRRTESQTPRPNINEMHTVSFTYIGGQRHKRCLFVG